MRGALRVTVSFNGIAFERKCFYERFANIWVHINKFKLRGY